MRGNRSRAECRSRWWRSIPACAGEPCGHNLRSHRAQVYPRVCGGTPICRKCRRPAPVYPRVCGGTAHNRADFKHVQGLSPRVRGNPLPVWHESERGGSIPACAGEPGQEPGATPVATVYPRVCGGTLLTPADAGGGQGLSPRVRGNPDSSPRIRASPGSIPACAGEPVAGMAAWSSSRVYPRVCGGTISRFCFL